MILTFISVQCNDINNVGENPVEPNWRFIYYG